MEWKFMDLIKIGNLQSGKKGAFPLKHMVLKTSKINGQSKKFSCCMATADCESAPITCSWLMGKMP